VLRFKEIVWLWGLLFWIGQVDAAKQEKSDHEEEVVIDMEGGPNYGTGLSSSKEKDSKKSKKKSRYEDDVMVDLDLNVPHMVNGEMIDEEESKKVLHTFGNRRQVAVKNVVNVDLLVAYNMTMMSMHAKKYNEMIMLIYNSALAKRKQDAREKRSTEENDYIFDIVDQVTTHFQDQSSGGTRKREIFRAQEMMLPIQEVESGDAMVSAMTESVILKIVQQELNKEKLSPEEGSATKDTAILLGSFLTTQAVQGKHPDPSDLVGFLQSIDFISIGQECVHWWAPRCGCSKQTEKLSVKVVTVVGFLIMLGLSGLSVAIQIHDIEQ
jgi:hypothetical protein